MRKLKTRILILALAAIFSTILPSCMTTKTSVGQYKELQGDEYTYAKGKQVWLFWGVIPLGRTNVNTPGDGNCLVTTKLNIGDFLISGLTCGVVTTQTIKIKAKKK